MSAFDLASLLSAAAALAGAAHVQIAQLAPAAQPGSAWSRSDYRPQKGEWRPYLLSPGSRRLAPASLLSAAARSGAIDGRPAAALVDDGVSVRLRSGGHRGGSPLLAVDFGQEVGGRLRVELAGASSPAPALHACFSESRKLMATGFGGEASLAPGCDSANYANGYPGVAYDWDSDSHALSLPDRLPGTAVDPQRRGGFRYLTLFLDGPGWVDVDGISLDFTAAGGQGADLSRYAGRFLSSDDLLNKIWYASAYTVQLDTDGSGTATSWPYAGGEADHADSQVPGVDPRRDVIFDGAKRDRIVWQGDLAVQDPVAWLTTGDGAAVDASLDALAGQQLDDGYVPAESLVGPHNRAETRFYGEYVSWFISNMYDHWLYTGDRTYLDRWWSALRRATAWIETQRDRRSGLLAFADDPGHYGYVDGGHETYVNALYVRNLDQMAALATVEGGAREAARFSARARAVADAVDARLWDASAGAYWTSAESHGQHPQDGNAMAIVAGIAPQRRARQVLAWLKANAWGSYGSLMTGRDEPGAPVAKRYAPLPTGFEVQARLLSGDAGDALALIRRFWGYQLEQDPHSTWWEGVSASGQPPLARFTSLAHGWGAAPATLLTTLALGVRPTGPGFATFAVAPRPGDLRWAQGTVPTPHGAIVVDWSRDAAGRWLLRLTVPSGTIGRVALPAAVDDAYAARGGSARDAGYRDGARVFTVAPGTTTIAPTARR